MTVVQPPRRRLAATVAIVLVAAWVALVALPPVAFLRWREARLEALSAPTVQREWDRFRDDMREDAEGRGPVRRKVPRSAEPPEKVWLRDYPGVVVAAWVIFVGLLGGVTGILLRGAASTPAPRGREADVSGPGSDGR
jgi:hypothetical protein